jgi:transglutaminase-like putative cysteine protease
VNALHVVHETAYRYSARVDLAYHLMHLSPRADEQQHLEAFDLAIEPEPTRVGTSHDVFGNLRTYCALTMPHDTLRVTATSRVVSRPSAGKLEPASSPPWESVRERLRYRAGAPFEPASQFVFASPFVPLLANLRDYAHAGFAKGQAWLAAAIELMHRIHEDFDYDPTATDVATPLAEVFAKRRGVCQDFAHVMIGCLRAIGLPAAYVSGYLLTRPPPGQPRLLGADASHAWVSVWCPLLGWVGLDPTNAVTAGGATHVTLALGRDYGDVMPLRGVIRGGGAHTLSVEVSVVPEEELHAANGIAAGLR